MKLIKKYIVILSLLVSVLDAKELPVESSLITGELENGFKYTIKQNAKPAAKAEIRLIVNVGSLEEDDDQKGVAHMVEHMAFNGSEHFPKNTLITYLESIGVAFGSHLNASTSTKRTLYKLSVPVEKDNLEKSFLIFEDWAGGLSFEAQELEKERGVILEEARSRDNVNFRLYKQSKETLYANSRYKDRTPIGDLEIVKNIKIDRVKAFYDEWYRPEFMHLVVVGDVDVERVKELIKKHFTHLKNSSTRQRASRSVPKVNTKRVLFVNDEELPSKSVGIYYFNNLKKVTTVSEYKDKVLKSIALKLFNLENSQQLTKKGTILNTLRASSPKLGDNLSMSVFEATYDDGDDLNALAELTQAVYLNERFGFSKESFDAVVKSMQNANELAYKRVGKGESATYAKRVVGHLLSDSVFIDEKFNYELLKELLSGVKIEDVNSMYKQLLQSESQLISFSLQTPSKLSNKDISTTMQRAKRTIKKPKKRKKLPTKLLAKDLPAKKILKETHNDKYDFWEYELENGVKVIYKYNNYKKGNVNLFAYTKGGYSLVEDELLTNAKLSTNIISKSGTQEYTLKDIREINAGKEVSYRAYIKRYTQGFSGQSNKKDFATLLEFIYLAHTDYKVDTNVLENFIRVAKQQVIQQNKNPKVKFSKEFFDFYMKNNARFKQMEVEDLKSVNSKDSLEIYKESFQGVNNFVYIVVGDIDYERVRLLTSSYLGNLPTSSRVNEHKNRDIKPLKGKEEFIRFYETQNISTVGLTYTQEEPYSLEESIKLGFLKELLNVKLRELVREEKSGVYGVRVKNTFSRVPYGRATLSISFTCDPKRRVELNGYIQDVIKDLKESVVEEKYISAIKKKKLIAFEQNRKTAKFWQSRLLRYAYNKDDINEIDSYEKLYNSVNTKDLNKMAKKYLKEENLLYSELNPKGDKK